jgi:Spy/CpxP family protein refolding chaperone
MTAIRTALVVLPLAACLSFGCDKKETPPTTAPSAVPSASAVAPATTASAMASAASSATKPHAMRGFGPAASLLGAAGKIDLKPAQKATLDVIEKQLEDGAGAARAEAKDLHDELLTEIKAGKIDTTKLAPKYDAIDKATQARLDKEATALNDLHAALEPAQRKAVVDHVRARQKARMEKWSKREAPDGGATAMHKRRAEHLTRDLDLDADQQKKVDAILAKEDPKAMEAGRADGMKKNDALLDAFDSDGFDAKKLDLFTAGKKAHAATEHEVTLLGQILPILKSEQREKLAAKMGRGMRRGGRGHMTPIDGAPQMPVLFGDRDDDDAPTEKP